MAPVELRPFRTDELAAVCALMDHADRHDGYPRVLAVAELEEILDAPHIDLAADTRLVERDGAVVACAWIWNPPSPERQERAFITGSVHPTLRGTGIGQRLMTWAVERCGERMRSRDHDLPYFVRATSYDWQEPNHRLFEHLGMKPVRLYDDMLCPLDTVVPAAEPEGIVVDAWPDDRDEELRLLRNAAFADHWGSAPLDADEWGDMLHGHGARLELSLIARDAASGATVALCLNHVYPDDEAVTGRREAWIHNVATIREHRGRGVASALIRRSLALFAGAGYTHAALGVDVDNPTGAARLYRQLGFATAYRTVTHELQLR